MLFANKNMPPTYQQCVRGLIMYTLYFQSSWMASCWGASIARIANLELTAATNNFLTSGDTIFAIAALNTSRETFLRYANNSRLAILAPIIAMTSHQNNVKLESHEQ